MSAAPPTVAPPAPAPAAPFLVNQMAGTMKGSEILRIATEIRARIAAGEQVCNLTVGDFDPKQFPIPKLLEDGIVAAIRGGETNYPPPFGMIPLREAIAEWYQRDFGTTHTAEQVLLTAGSRPGIYGAFATLVEPGERVVYGVPSWNANYYCHIVGAEEVPIVCTPEEGFLPTARRIGDALRGARLLVLNSPLNPTGTAISAEALGEICDLVLAENHRRGAHERPLFLLYDQVYWQLTFGGTKHVHPIGVRPQMAPYTIYVDGVSKAFAATGIRVGWVLAPAGVIKPMGDFLTHVGTWAPKAEQIATLQLLKSPETIAEFRKTLTSGLEARLTALHSAIVQLKKDGNPVDALQPQGAMYLSARFNIFGKTDSAGTTIRTNDDIRRWLLREVGFGVVQFQAFALNEESGWFRLSAGAVSMEDIANGMARLKSALGRLR